MAAEVTISRLQANEMPHVVDCFQRVYGNSYANPMFYDTTALTTAVELGHLLCVGAFAGGRLVGHMAMTRLSPQATSVEMGNTVVDPLFRGAGIAWQIGNELIQWAEELGFWGFLHYPTTDHHIMQQHSVKAGFETGLMLGYIPAETDGKVQRSTDSKQLRQAATVVYQPLKSAPFSAQYCPEVYRKLIDPMMQASGLRREWRTPTTTQGSQAEDVQDQYFPVRGLWRATVACGADAIDHCLANFLDAQAQARAPCQQLDLSMNDATIAQGVTIAQRCGFSFCAWLPGYAESDVLRLQRVNPAVTDLSPNVTNPIAKQLLKVLTANY
jgi:GNAT superfamily N-acetyltransferase